MRRFLLAFSFALALVPGLLGFDLMGSGVLNLATAQASTPDRPAALSRVSARSGPGVGEITLSWKSTGKHTNGFVLETALSWFTKTDLRWASSGRRPKVTRIAGNRRSIVLSARTVSWLGAGIASGNALFYRLYAVHSTSAGRSVHAYPYLQAVLPRPAAPKAHGTRVRVASFNVRTARATHDKRAWNQRAPQVAAEIIRQRPGVVALQELGPGRADGKTGTTKGTPRQTTSLLTAQAKAGRRRYRLVRTTPYVAPGKPTATQGARILYDSSRYKLLTRCPERTRHHGYSSSCTIVLPLLAGDRETLRRRGAMAQFRDRKTGKKFWFVSVHLDDRHSSNRRTELRYDVLRGRQAAAILPRVARFNSHRVPVIIGGDFNSWQNHAVGNRAHDRLVAAGCYDASAAVRRIHFAYTTFTRFKVTVPKASQGLGVRLDQLFVKGARGASLFENVMKVTDRDRSSDHNLILADLVL